MRVTLLLLLIFSLALFGVEAVTFAEEGSFEAEKYASRKGKAEALRTREV